MVGPIPENRAEPDLSDRFSGVFFPGSDVNPSRESLFPGLPCKQIIPNIGPIFTSNYGTDNLHF